LIGNRKLDELSSTQAKIAVYGVLNPSFMA
jgi:hypothetical protein